MVCKYSYRKYHGQAQVTPSFQRQPGSVPEKRRSKGQNKI
jgi:hypothetical protein